MTENQLKKVENIDIQIKKNQEKINKLLFINDELKISKSKIVMKELVEPIIITKEERTIQSQKDKEEFKTRLSHRFSNPE